MPKFPVVYQRRTVHVELDSSPKEGRCDACGKECGKGIKQTAIHHHKYAYSWKYVSEHPEAALHYTSELDYSCHQIGNALMVLMRVKLESVDRIMGVARLMPDDLKEKMDKLCSLWLEERWK